MIKTPLSTVIGGAFWAPGATIIGSQNNINQLIKSLFSDGTQGIYLNAQDALSVSDLSSIKDLSGRNNHALQSNSTSRASLITDPSGYKSLKFDGIDDGYVTQSINFTNTDKVTVIAAVRKLSDATTAIICELSANLNNNTGSFYFSAPPSSGFPRFGAVVKGVTAGNVESGTLTTPASAVTSLPINLLSKSLNLKVNGITTLNGASLGGGNFGNYPLYVGRRGGTSLPFNGQIYALLVIGKLLDDATTAKIEKEFAKYIGVTL